MNQPLFIYAEYPGTATVALTNAVPGQTGADVLQANEDTYVSPLSNTLSITLDLKSAFPSGCLAIAGENLNGVALALRASTDNFVTSDVEISASSALSGFVAAWRPFSTVAYRYYRLVFTGATSAMKIYHVALLPLRLLPYLADGADLDAFQSTANHIVSPQGHFLGSQLVKSEHKIPLNWGQVMESEYPLFTAWALACVQTPSAFFFVPDSGVTTCMFGYTDQNYKFSAPMKNGLRKLAAIPFTSRKP